MSAKNFVQSITAVFSSISALMLAVTFLQGLAESSHDTNAIFTYSLAFLLSWYVLGAITEAVADSVEKILIFFGVPPFMKSSGFRKLNDILKKEKPNELERNIFTSIRLFASACDVIVTKSSIRRPIGLGFPSEKDSSPKTTFEEISLNERLVRLFIALESLLIFDENEPLVHNMSERAAFLLVKSKKSRKETYDRRKRIKTFIIDMYRLRSNYVHHGKRGIDHNTLQRFMWLVQAIILKVTRIRDRMKLTTVQDLKDWFERKKLS